MLVPNQYAVVEPSADLPHYKSLGYLCDQYKIKVPAEDISPLSTQKVNIQCDQCGKIFKRSFNLYTNSINSTGSVICKECADKNRIHNNYLRVSDFCKENNYTLLSQEEDMKNSDAEIQYLCSIHGLVKTTVGHAISNRRCYKCTRNMWTSSLYDRQNKIYQDLTAVANKNGYEILTTKNDIISTKTKIKYLCQKHGEQEMSISNMLCGKKCKYCGFDAARKRCKKDEQSIIDNVAKFGGEVINPEEYQNQTTKNLKIKCPLCGGIFVTSYRNFVQHGGQVCEDCANTKSIGENIIEKYLIDHNVDYYKEYWFDDCRSINPLPFDFYCPSFNSIIEFDGRQHFEETNYFSSSLEEVQKHDSIKNNYCKINNIKLLRIPYWEIGNINKLIETFLHKDIV